LVRLLLPLPGLHTLRLPPRGDRRTSSRTATLTPTQRVIDRIHGDPADLGPLSGPAGRTRLAENAELVVAVADLPDRRHALLAEPTNLRRGEANRDVIAFLRDHADRRSRRPRHLSALARLELHVVDRRAQRNPLERERMSDDDVGPLSGAHDIADREPLRVQDVALLAVLVGDEGDVRATVRIVLHCRHAPGNAGLVPPEIDPTVSAL